MAIVFVVSVAVLVLAYFVYGRKLTAWLGVQPERPTPAHVMRDGIDYVPTPVPILFGHHFSSIAGAGPIVGPVLAGVGFGWLPVLLWIVLGAVFIGGAHDYAALMVSIRHRGRSIGEICRMYLSPATYRAFLAFVWFTLIYVMVVFLDLTATTFAPSGEAMRSGGSVATASLFYILLAVLFGLCIYRWKVHYKKASFIFVPLVFVGLYIGRRLPIVATMLPAWIYDDPRYTWICILLIYCFAASVLPVWMLL